MMTEPFIALSVLSLDIDEPTNGWAASLAARGVSVVIDDIGRLSVRRDDARRLFTERREAIERARELNAKDDAEIERQRRAQRPKGVEWWRIPEGLSYAEYAPMSDPPKSARPGLTAASLFGEEDSMVYQEFPADGDGS
jgi:hypothetical protein